MKFQDLIKHLKTFKQADHRNFTKDLEDFKQALFHFVSSKNQHGKKNISNENFANKEDLFDRLEKEGELFFYAKALPDPKIRESFFKKILAHENEMSGLKEADDGSSEDSERPFDRLEMARFLYNYGFGQEDDRGFKDDFYENEGMRLLKNELEDRANEMEEERDPEQPFDHSKMARFLRDHDLGEGAEINDLIAKIDDEMVNVGADDAEVDDAGEIVVPRPSNVVSPNPDVEVKKLDDDSGRGGSAALE